MRESYGTHGMNAITDYIWQNVLGVSGQDDEVSDGMGSGATLVGKRILEWDDAGFATTSRYASAEDLTEAWQAQIDHFHIHKVTCYVCGSHDHCGCTCGFCEICHDYHPDTCKPLDEWDTFVVVTKHP